MLWGLHGSVHTMLLPKLIEEVLHCSGVFHASYDHRYIITLSFETPLYRASPPATCGIPARHAKNSASHMSAGSAAPANVKQRTTYARPVCSGRARVCSFNIYK